MKRLDEIPKKNVFEVPDGYFDQLALKIQAKTETISPAKKTISGWSFALRYALPVLLLVIGGIIVWKPKTVQDTEQLLASIPTEHLIDYLHESEIAEAELLEVINFDDRDVDSLNVHVHTQYAIDDLEMNEIKSVLENEL
ncbi:MAG TPA: hypothetical protein VL728_09415 [Cyclobacteriaceae bacterium]|jgi:hypothetical protein|nr:hypothetical protein [Cyclobacteriaceae bacterium]